MSVAALPNVLPTFPVGVQVAAYADLITDSGEPRPLGPELDNAVVSPTGELTFTSLPADATAYVAAALVGGKWAFLYFSTPPGPDELEGETAARIAADTALSASLAEKVDLTDSRLTDARTPKAHAASHAAGGSDPLTPGAIGAAAACRYRFLSKTGTLEDPGAGKLNLNAGKTILVLSETDLDGRALAPWIATFDDSTNGEARGTITLRKASEPAVFAVYRVTGELTDVGVFDRLPVVLIASGGEFANEDIVTLEFSRAGDKGATGATGASGAAPYRMLLVGRARLESAAGSGFYRTGQTYLRNIKYNAEYAAGTAEDSLPALLRLAAADLAVEGKTTKLRLRIRVSVNGTKPEGVVFTAGLYVMSAVSGAENKLVLSFPGSAIGTTAAVNSPAASATAEVDSGDFNIVADGLYGILIQTNAALTAKSLVAIEVELLARNV